MNRKIVAGVVAPLAFVVGMGLGDVADAGPRGTDTRCQLVAQGNRRSRDLDRVMNYHGCDEAYRDGRLIGWRNGDSRCERAAYRGSLVKKLDGAAFHAYMGRTGCVLYEDWSWGDE